MCLVQCVRPSVVSLTIATRFERSPINRHGETLTTCAAYVVDDDCITIGPNDSQTTIPSTPSLTNSEMVNVSCEETDRGPLLKTGGKTRRNELWIRSTARKIKSDYKARIDPFKSRRRKYKRGLGKRLVCARRATRCNGKLPHRLSDAINRYGRLSIHRVPCTPNAPTVPKSTAINRIAPISRATRLTNFSLYTWHRIAQLWKYRRA